ncbi:uncharacterized protein [Onthophagus taurus]|uniref:uncharacterized protein n=1 Tax=Onthophagus taurus TaxID=166361 RepID=UPI0039BE322D
MNRNVAQQLIAAREDVKHKIRTLKGDIKQKQSIAEAQLAPLKEPLTDISKKLQTVNLLALDNKFGIKRDLFTPKKEQSPDISALLADLQKPSKGLKLETPRVKPKRRVTSTPIKPGASMDVSPELARSPQFLSDEEVFEGRDTTPEVSVRESDTSLDVYERDAREQLARMKENMEGMMEQTVIREALGQLDPLPRTYVTGLTVDVNNEFDQTYGVRALTDGLYIANQPITFDGKNILVGEFTYTGTPGLYELLFKNKPGKFTLPDARNYKDILQRSNVHKRDYDASKSIITDDENEKFVNIIKPISLGQRPNVYWARYWPKPKTGSGHLNKLLVPAAIKEYEYWDDVNELVDRLRLLLASEAAGHTAHHNEIISLIEELREAQVIR